MVLKSKIIICVILNYKLDETIPYSIQQLELYVKLEVVTRGSCPLDLVTWTMHTNSFNKSGFCAICRPTFILEIPLQRLEAISRTFYTMTCQEDTKLRSYQQKTCICKCHIYILIPSPHMLVANMSERFLQARGTFRAILAIESHWLQPVLVLFVRWWSAPSVWGGYYIAPTPGGAFHAWDWEPMIITLQALSLVEKAEPIQVRFTLHLRDQRSMWMQDGCNVYVDSYMASYGSCFMVTWTIFKNHFLEVGLTQNQETIALGMLTTIELFYFVMYEDPHE
jgi:hypothetical protein